MAEIYPERGPDAFAAMFEALVPLVDDVRQIQATTDGPRLGVMVPDDVAVRYAALLAPEEPATAETPKKKKGV